MASTSSRTLRLLSLLQNQRYWSGADLADRLEVSVRTLRRDVERLRDLGYPVDAHRGVAGGYQLAAGAALPPLLLDDDEAVALAVGLHAATSSTVAGMAESSVGALTKLVQVMPPRLRRRVEALRAMTVSAQWDSGGADVDPVLLTTAAQACRDDERLHLSYVAADGARSERTVEPHRLVSLGRRWYLVAYDLSRHDWRSFRLDRLERLEREGSRFLPRQVPHGDAAEFVRRGIRGPQPAYDVSAAVEAPANEVRRRLGHWATVEELGERRCRVRMSVESLDWAALSLGLLDAELSAVSPSALVAKLQLLADRLHRAAAASPEGVAGESVSQLEVVAVGDTVVLI